MSKACDECGAAAGVPCDLACPMWVPKCRVCGDSGRVFIGISPEELTLIDCPACLKGFWEPGYDEWAAAQTD